MEILSGLDALPDPRRGLRRHDRRRIRHVAITEHPTADWTAQQFRMVVSGDHTHRWVIHDRDSIYSEGVDATVVAMGLTILKTPVRAPQAKAHCERVIGTIRRECLDWMIPCSERHLRRILQEWVAHYNRGRPHASLGPGIPDPSSVRVTTQSHRIGFRPAIGSSRGRSSAGYITSTTTGTGGLNGDNLDRTWFLRSTPMLFDYLPLHERSRG